MSIIGGFGVKQLQLMFNKAYTFQRSVKFASLFLAQIRFFVISGGKKGLAGGGRTQKSGEIASLLRHMQQLDENAIGESCS